MQTYLGFEVEFCHFCGRQLKEILSGNRRWVFAACPKRVKWFGLNIDDRHAFHFIRDYQPTKYYDEKTGKKLV